MIKVRTGVYFMDKLRLITVFLRVVMEKSILTLKSKKQFKLFHDPN